MTKTWTHNGTKVSGRFYYVRLRDSQPTVDELIEVAHARMVNFAIPRLRINEAVQAMVSTPSNIDQWVRLVTEARDLFIKTDKETGRSGELGELLLYMLLEWVLKAPIVACKMYLKTSLQMPVHGTDGIHLGSDGNNLVFYWGESKLHGTLSSALADIMKSISEHTSSVDKYKNEVRIIRSNLNVDELDSQALEALKKYFNPYAEESNNYQDCYACLAGFDSKIYEKVKDLPSEESESEFEKLYEKRVSEACDLIAKKVSEAGLDTFRFSFFLLPFPSVDSARQKFQDKLWGKS
ncbi:HamA C-terminal domain-containing protein [Pseudomonas aeruginosa]|uniref:HamA C-terminal domain-containing protein n=1 Tax=Pseudomonas aeruginosa TaxID=287 RepID=UPI0013CE30C4|nr:DUF1837 domain-containing protein [Pseudomonas aeruginosa]HBO2745113.1 DUF1837 domain-containing protein [Pseudomonas aeruginosa]HDY6331754.1 DUF1837 domain-containing protein [Pseudomonas aeruginosa]